MNNFELAEEADGEQICVVPNLVFKRITQKGFGRPLTDNDVVRMEISSCATKPYRLLTAMASPHCYEKRISDVVPVGLRLALQGMLINECSTITIKPGLGYGDFKFTLESGETQRFDRLSSVLLFKVHIVKTVPSLSSLTMSDLNRQEFWDKQQDEICEQFEQAQEELSRGKKQQAFRCYLKALQIARMMAIDAEKKPEYELVRQRVVEDMTLCVARSALEISNFRMAVTFGRQALEFSEENSEAFFIVGSAYFSMGFYKSAQRFLRKAHYAELDNELYKERIEDVSTHLNLIDDRYDDEEDTKDYEDFAEVLMKQIENKKKVILQTLQKFLQERVDEGQTEISIGGGFPAKMLGTIAKKLNKSRINNVKLRAVVTGNTLEIVV